MVGAAGGSRTGGGGVRGVLIDADGSAGVTEGEEQHRGGGATQISPAVLRATTHPFTLISPLQALQFVQGEVKDAGHVVVGGPAAGQLVL